MSTWKFLLHVACGGMFCRGGSLLLIGSDRSSRVGMGGLNSWTGNDCGRDRTLDSDSGRAGVVQESSWDKEQNKNDNKNNNHYDDKCSVCVIMFHIFYLSIF